MEADSSYFARRSEQEKAAAQSALDPIAQCAHLELAMRYDQLAEAAERIFDESGSPVAGAGPGYMKAWVNW